MSEEKEAASPEFRGKLVEGDYQGRKYKPGTVFHYWLYVPFEYDGTTPAALLIAQDGLNESQILVIDRLIPEGAMPVCIALFINPGILKPTRPDGAERAMRAEEYDQVGRGYPDFLADEIVPWIAEKEHLNISDSPDMHLISGSSSGGLCAWNAAWFRNDFFRRAFLCSPSFVAFRGGEELMTLARKSETRPIRSYLTVGTDEPNQYAGNSYLVALSAQSALNYAGYDFAFELFEGGGHTHGRCDLDVQERVFRYLWADWDTKPVMPGRNQPRIEGMFDLGSRWTQTDEAMPEKTPAATQAGVFSFRGGGIFLTTPGGEKKAVAEDFQEITAIALSTDRWRLYVADKSRRYVFAMSICPDGSLKDRYILAPIHLAPDCRTIGAMDLCVDIQDRVYTATELGIQGIVSFGINDSIIPLPGDLPAEGLAFGGEAGDVMYARSGGRVFKRRWKVRGHRQSDPPMAPPAPGYGN
jgi:gluconolactonase